MIAILCVKLSTLRMYITMETRGLPIEQPQNIQTKVYFITIDIKYIRHSNITSALTSHPYVFNTILMKILQFPW